MLASTFTGFNLNANHEIENLYPRLNSIGKYADAIQHNKVKTRKSIHYNEQEIENDRLGKCIMKAKGCTESLNPPF